MQKEERELGYLNDSMIKHYARMYIVKQIEILEEILTYPEDELLYGGYQLYEKQLHIFKAELSFLSNMDMSHDEIMSELPFRYESGASHE